MRCVVPNAYSSLRPGSLRTSSSTGPDPAPMSIIANSTDLVRTRRCPPARTGPLATPGPETPPSALLSARSATSKSAATTTSSTRATSAWVRRSAGSPCATQRRAVCGAALTSCGDSNWWTSRSGPPAACMRHARRTCSAATSARRSSMPRSAARSRARWPSCPRRRPRGASGRGARSSTQMARYRIGARARGVGLRYRRRRGAPEAAAVTGSAAVVAASPRCDLGDCVGHAARARVALVRVPCARPPTARRRALRVSVTATARACDVAFASSPWSGAHLLCTPSSPRGSAQCTGRSGRSGHQPAGVGRAQDQPLVASRHERESRFAACVPGDRPQAGSDRPRAHEPGMGAGTVAGYATRWSQGTLPALRR
jgi:hypothetical protein